MLREIILATTLATTVVAAEPSDAAASAVSAEAASAPGHLRYAGRLEAGVGILAVQAGLSAEYWLSKPFGVGLHGGGFGFVLPFGHHGSAGVVGPTVTFRTRPNKSYGLLSIGTGIGSYETTTSDGLCFDWDGDGTCRPPRHESGLAPYFGGSMGWLFHVEGLEIGPLVRFDHAGDAWALTLNFAIGMAVGDRRR